MMSKNWIHQQTNGVPGDCEPFSTDEGEILLFSPDHVNTPDMEACISIIKKLPDLIIKYRHGIRLPQAGGKELAMLNLIRGKYRSIAKWLEVYRLDQTYLLIELKRSKTKHYKPFAEIANARYELALELFGRDDLVFPCHRVTGQPLEPRWWMLLTVGQDCEAELNKSGFLTGVASPEPKSSISKTHAQPYRELPKGGISEVSEPCGSKLSLLPIVSPFYNPISSLVNLALFVAETDIEWRNGYYYEFAAKMRRCYRTIERDSALTAMYQDENGNLKKLGRGQDTRTSKKKPK
jgi:hypothetical protein